MFQTILAHHWYFPARYIQQVILLTFYTPDLLLFSFHQNNCDTFLVGLQKSNRSIISGFKPVLGVVNWLNIFKVFMWDSLMSWIFLLVNCLNAVADVWHMLRHHLIIIGCHLILLLSFFLACSFCCCQSNHCGVSGSNVHSV